MAKTLSVLLAFTAFMVNFAVIHAQDTGASTSAPIDWSQYYDGTAYTIRPGDSLSQLSSQHYHDPLLYNSIINWTAQLAARDSSFATIADPRLIRPGWKVWIPTAPTIARYTVRPGDTLASIAEKVYGTSDKAVHIAESTRVQSYSDPSLTYVDDALNVEAGDVLFLPYIADPGLIPYTDLQLINGQWETVDDTTLRFIGNISADTPAGLERVLGDKIETIIVTSAGGDTGGGIAVGEIIQDRGLNVVVEGLCASSCANYFFSPASNKTVAEDSWVGYHGNVTALLSFSETALRNQGVSEETIAASLALQAAQAEHEHALFTNAGIDQTLFDYSQVQGQLTDAIFWAPSPAQLASLGLKNMEEMWYPAAETELEALGAAMGLHIIGGPMADDWQELYE